MLNRLNLKTAISNLVYSSEYLIPKIVKKFIIFVQLVILMYFGLNVYAFNIEYIKIFGYLKQLHNYVNTSELIAIHYFYFVLGNTFFIIVFSFFIFLQISYKEGKRIGEGIWNIARKDN